MTDDRVTLTGMVVSEAPAGEADRRVVLLTKERGRITAFARGARRPGSQLMASTRPYAFGKITLIEKRNSYGVLSFEVSNYFEKLSSDLENACYSAYFSEFAEYYAKEGLEAGSILKLLYLSFLALQKGSIPKELVRAVFELKLMVINGEYTEAPLGCDDPTVIYAWNYVIESPIEKVFSFVLKDGRETLFSNSVSTLAAEFVEKDFKSLEILNTML